MAKVRKRRRRRKAVSSVSTHRRRHRRARLANPTRRRRRSARRSYRRRKTNALARRSYRRTRARRGHRRSRRNPATVASRAYSAGRSIFSVKMAKNIAAGVAGFAGVNLLEPFIPIAPTTNLGVVFKKGLAAVGAYMIGAMVLSSPLQKRYLMYGAAFNLGLDLVRTQFPSVAERAKLSGYVNPDGIVGGTGEAIIDRLIPTAITTPYA